MTDFSSRLQSVRKKSPQSPSQVDVASALNIAQSTYARFESGSREPPLSFIINFCRYFNVSSDYLLGLSDVPTIITSVQNNTSTENTLASITMKANAKIPSNPFSNLHEDQIIHVKALIQSYEKINFANGDIDMPSQQEA